MDAVSWVKKNTVKAIGIAVVAILVACGAYLLSRNAVIGNSNEETILFDSEAQDSHDEDDRSEKSSDRCSGFNVDISGAVMVPGVYCIDDEGIVRDVIEAAGGINDGACIRWVERSLNQSQFLAAEMKLYIPFVEDPECIISISQEGGGESDVLSEGKCPDGLVHLNTASQSEIETLPGVGPSLAQKIIEERPFSNIEELNDVPGIGDVTYEKLKKLVCL